jgi:hypothetical protein
MRAGFAFLGMRRVFILVAWSGKVFATILKSNDEFFRVSGAKLG